MMKHKQINNIKRKKSNYNIIYTSGMPSHNWEGWKNSSTVCKLSCTVMKMAHKFWSEKNSFSII